MLLSIAPAHPPDLSAGSFRLLVESVQDYAIFMLDVNGNIRTWNNGAQRIKGYSADEIIGRHFSTFYTEEDRAAGVPERALRTAVRDGRVEYEGWRVRKDGSRFWANVVITALYDEKGALQGFGKVTRDLTERRNIAEELRRSEERFRLLIEGIRDYAVYMLDPTGHVHTWNSGAENIKGYKASEIIGRHYSTFFLPEDVAAGRPERELEIARSSGRYEEEGWRVRKDGTPFWANIVLTALRDDNGELVGFAKVTRDLTARKHAEETARELVRERAARAAAEEAEDRIRAERERYRALSSRLEVILESIADGLTVEDRSGAVVFANSAAARLWGYGSVEELVRATSSGRVEGFELFDEKGKPFDVRALPARRVLAGEPTSSALVRVRRQRSGYEWWATTRARPVLSADGEPELAVSIWHDITAERRRSKQEKCLASATAMLSSSLDHVAMLRSLAEVLVPGLADWCAIHVLEGERLQNVALAHGDGERTALAREYVSKYLANPSARSRLWQAVRTGEPDVHEDVSDAFLRERADDEEELELLRTMGITSVLIVPLRVRERVSGTLSLVSMDPARRYDRTDVALAAELCRRASITIENARLYAEAQEAARVAAEAARTAEEASRVKDEFLATVSHELRTPLNAILGWATLLRARSADPSLAKGIEVIHRNAHAQSKIIEDILDVSRIITGKLRLDLKSADLVAIVRDAVEVVRPSAAAKRIFLDFDAPPEPCSLVADPERLQQVVWNILSNAVKFTDEGGSIGITIEQAHSHLRLSVSDSGRGIDPAFLPYVFDRFKQADASSTRRVGGLGLGLAIVRHIVELHGGRVDATSEGLGKGATFSISLPVRAVAPTVRGKETPSSRGAEQPPNEAFASLTGLRVLVVDDEPDARDLLQLLLETAGASVRVAASAATAFDLVQCFRPDVLVSDIAMPEEDGYGLMRRIRNLDPALGGGIPSIALTAYARGEDKVKALGAGFTTHIGKPVKPEDLVLAVAELAGAREAGEAPTA